MNFVVPSGTEGVCLSVDIDEGFYLCQKKICIHIENRKHLRAIFVVLSISSNLYMWEEGYAFGGRIKKKITNKYLTIFCIICLVDSQF